MTPLLLPVYTKTVLTELPAVDIRQSSGAIAHQCLTMLSPIWDNPHLGDGDPEPVADHEKVTVLNMR